MKLADLAGDIPPSKSAESADGKTRAGLTITAITATEAK